jgi:hypothetical protein
MRSKLALLSTAAALAIGLAGSAYAVEESPTKVPGTGVEGQASDQNPGNLQAPEKDPAASAESPSDSGPTDRSAANVPGSGTEGDAATDNPGSLSAPERDADSMKSGLRSGESNTKTY